MKKRVLFFIPLLGLLLTGCSRTIKVDKIRNVSYDNFSITQENQTKALKSSMYLYQSNSTYHFSGEIIAQSGLYNYVVTYGNKASEYSYIKMNKGVLYDNTVVDLTYVGTDSKNKIAVYKFLKKNYDVVPATKSSSSCVKTDRIMTISTTSVDDSFNNLNTMRVGVISNASMGCFNTSCDLSIADLGAGVFDESGNLVGIIDSVVSSSGESNDLTQSHVIAINQGMNYDLVYSIYQDIVNSGDVTRGLLGVTVTNYEIASIRNDIVLPENAEPMVAIVSVSPGSPAYYKGLKTGYLIRKVDDIDINRLSDMNYMMALKNPGDSVKLGYYNTDYEYNEITIIVK